MHHRAVVTFAVSLLITLGPVKVQAGDSEVLTQHVLAQADAVPAEVLGLEASDRFGPNIQWTIFGGSQFQPEATDEDGCYLHSYGYYTATIGGGPTYFTLDVGPSLGIPIGAALDSVCLNLLDSSATGEVRISLWENEQPTGNVGPPAIRQLGSTESTGVSQTPGYTQLCVVPTAVTIHSFEDVNGDSYSSWVSYALQLRAERSLNVRWGGGVVWWRRQVSPAPASATFTDVPTGHWAFQFVEALAASGITAGCSANQYCPDAPLTRAQMAVFLAKGLGLDFLGTG